MDLQAALSQLTEQRREQAMRFKHEQGRRESAAAFLLLWRALRDEYGLEEPPVLAYDDGGKPFLAGHPEIHFNMSHCRVAVACVVDRRPVGIDVETIRKYNPQLAAYTMNDEELRRIEASAEPEVEFTRLWTMKEALLKMSGTGLRQNLKTVLTGMEDMETWLRREKGYVCTVCRSRELPYGNDR